MSAELEAKCKGLLEAAMGQIIADYEQKFGPIQTEAPAPPRPRDGCRIEVRHCGHRPGGLLLVVTRPGKDGQEETQAFSIKRRADRKAMVSFIMGL